MVDMTSRYSYQPPAGTTSTVNSTRLASSAPHDDEVPVRTRLWCTIVMVPLASFMCVLQTSFAAQSCSVDSPLYLWYILAVLTGMAAGFLLLARSGHPQVTFWLACTVVVIFPFDSLIALMASTSLLARRSSQAMTIRTVVVTAIVAVFSQLRDALNPAEASVWHTIFARPNTGGDTGVPIEMLASESTIIITAIVTALVETAIATLLGLHIRSQAVVRAANAKADAAANQAQTLRFDLNNQQLADAIAAEAHDTLAHSLSLIALNASALQAESEKLTGADNRSTEYITHQSQAIAEQAKQIRRQAAGALDEAHSIIDMLRHPEQARIHLAPDDDTALTRESLSSLISDARVAGMTVDTWIDIRQLSELDENIGKIAYRAIQEGLTNARRHALGTPISLEVSAAPEKGVHIHLSNPTADWNAVHAADETSAGSQESPTAQYDVDGDAATTPLTVSSAHNTDTTQHMGTGLQGITARTRSVGGTCTYGHDDRNLFHLDVVLPWMTSPAYGGSYTNNRG